MTKKKTKKEGGRREGKREEERERYKTINQSTNQSGLVPHTHNSSTRKVKAGKNLWNAGRPVPTAYWIPGQGKSLSQIKKVNGSEESHLRLTSDLQKGRHAHSHMFTHIHRYKVFHCMELCYSRHRKLLINTYKKIHS